MEEMTSLRMPRMMVKRCSTFAAFGAGLVRRLVLGLVVLLGVVAAVFVTVVLLAAAAAAAFVDQ